MKYLICVLSFCVNPFQGFAVCLDDISERSVFEEISSFTSMRRGGLCEILTPIIKKHLASTNGDPLSALTDYLSHHEAGCLVKENIDPLETLALFSPPLSLSNLKGSYCYAINENLSSLLPKEIKAYFVPATLFLFTQQPYQSILSLFALPIPSSPPNEEEGKGYILLDLHLKMEPSILALFSGKPDKKNLKEKGICTFFYEEGKIIYRRNLSTEENDFSMIYYIKEIKNSSEIGLRSILAGDRRSLLFSRTEEGQLRAYLCLLFNENLMRYSLEGNPKKEIPFEKFLLEKSSLDKKLIDQLEVEEGLLFSYIKKILIKKDLIDDLYQKYIHLLNSDKRLSEFYILFSSIQRKP